MQFKVPPTTAPPQESATHCGKQPCEDAKVGTTVATSQSEPSHLPYQTHVEAKYELGRVVPWGVQAVEFASQTAVSTGDGRLALMHSLRMGERADIIPESSQPPVAQSPTTDSAPALSQEQLQQLVGGSAAQQLSEVAAFNALNHADQQRFAEVFTAMGAKRDALRCLAHVDKVDLLGTRLLDSLHQIATQPLAAGLKPRDLLNAIVQEIDQPEEIDQNHSLTCTATALQYALVQSHPAEYARIVAQLATTGKAQLARGDEAKLVADSMTDHARPDERSCAERLFQAAVMELGNGPMWQYSDRLDRSWCRLNGEVLQSKGLDSGEVERAAAALFGSQYEIKVFKKYHMPEAERTAANPKFHEIMQALQSRPKASCIVSLKWKDARPESFFHTARDESAHAVNFIAAHDGRVFFRNPHGKQSLVLGGSLDDPPRRIDDKQQGIESMTEEEFARRLNLVIVPSAGNEP